MPDIIVCSIDNVYVFLFVEHKRSLVSAPDNRYSSRTMGLFGTACIVIVVGVLVAFDCVNICQKCSKTNKVRTEK